MRLVQVVDSLAPGGAERSLAAMAGPLVERGVDLTVIQLLDRDGVAPLIAAAGGAVRTLRPGSRASAVAQIAGLLSELRPDVVHTTLFEADIAGRVAAAWRRLPVVSSLVSTSYGPEHYQKDGIRRSRIVAAHALDCATAHLVTRFHAVSGVVADTMAARLRIPRDRIEVVWRGRDRAGLGRRTEARRVSTRRALGIHDALPLLVMLGRHEDEKGIDIAVRALAVLRAELPDVRLLVAGRSGNATARLQTQIHEAGLDHAVSLLGARDDVGDLLCAADVFLLPSRREGLPGAVLEAMALEAPIVASDLPTIREALGPETVAELVPVADPAALARAVRLTLADPTGAAARALRGRERFDSCFTIERAVDKMLALYERSRSRTRR